MNYIPPSEPEVIQSISWHQFLQTYSKVFLCHKLSCNHVTFWISTDKIIFFLHPPTIVKYSRLIIPGLVNAWIVVVTKNGMFLFPNKNWSSSFFTDFSAHDPLSHAEVVLHEATLAPSCFQLFSTLYLFLVYFFLLKCLCPRKQAPSCCSWLFFLILYHRFDYSGPYKLQ